MRRVSLAAAVLLLLLAGFGAYARLAIVDGSAFRDRAEAAFAQPDVQDEVAARLESRLVDAHPELAGRGGEVRAAIGDAVRDPRFGAVFREGTDQLHQALFDDPDTPVALYLPGAMAMVRAGGPLPEAPALFTLGGGGPLERDLRGAAPAAGRVAAWWPVALVLALLLLVRLGPRSAGLAVAIAGGIVAVATVLAELALLRTFTSQHGDAVVSAIWDSYLGDLRVAGALLAAAGLAVTAWWSLARRPAPA